MHSSYTNILELETLSREKNYQMPPKPRPSMTSSQPSTKRKSMGSAFDTADDDEGGSNKWLSCGGKDCQMWTFSWVPDEYTDEKLKKQLFLCGLCAGKEMQILSTQFTANGNFLKEKINSLQEEVKTLTHDLNTLKHQAVVNVDDFKQKTDLLNTELEVLKQKEATSPSTVVDAITEGSFAQALKSNISNIVSDKTTCAAIAKEITEEGKRQSSKENNLVIKGIIQSDEDNELVHKILTELKLELTVTVKDVKRIGRPDKDTGLKPLLLIELADKTEKLRVLKEANKLKNNDAYKNVYINPDLTRTEMESQFNLRAELKKRRNEKPDDIHYIRDDNIISHARTKGKEVK